LCMSISLKFLKWAGEDPDASRIKELLEKDNLSPEETKEVEQLLSNTDILIVR
jgi:hypothetical protein